MGKISRVTAPIHPDWDAFTSLSASVDGWDIFPGFGESKVRPFMLERRTELGTFASDEAAWRHVWAKAEAGSDLHVRALAFLKRHSPVEHAEIRKHGMGLVAPTNRFHPKETT